MSDLGVAKGRVLIDTSDVRRAQNEVQSASKIMTQALGAIGIATGAAQFARFVTDAEQMATSFRRQSIAARELAGSQEQLNALLETYGEATGGAIGKAASLANVTKLMSVGFADSTEELEKFARVIRGISTAMGVTQDYVTQNLILELFTQRGMRLDQLGLQYDKVKQRADELAAADSNLTAQMAYQQAVLEQAEKRFGKLASSAAGAATGMERLGKAWADFQLQFGEGAGGGTNLIFNQWATDIERATKELEQFSAFLERVERAGRQFRFDIGIAPYGPGTKGIGAPPWMASVDAARATPAAPRFDADQTAAIVEWSAGVRAIERQANADRLDATRQYEEQRTSTIREYGKTIAREAEDFARSRARAEQDYARAISDVREAAARRELRMAEDLARTVAQARQDSAERLADMQEQFERTVATRRADSAERIAEWEADRNEAIATRRKESTERLIDLEEQFTRERERAMRDSRDRLFAAASRFDAYAIAQERRRMAREQEERLLALREQTSSEREKLAEGVRQLQEAHRERLEDERRALDKSIAQAQEAYNRQVSDEREALAKRISQANEAHARQLEDAREADAERLEDMSESHAERLRREDEDRRTRLNRLAIDHNDQLNEMARQHGLRLTQITEQATEERQQLDEEFRKELDALGIRTAQWTAAQTQITDYAIAEFDRWWARIEEIANGLAAIGPSLAPINPWSGPVFGGNNLSSGGSIGGGANISVAPGAIQVFAATGQNPMDIAGAVRTQMEELFRQLMGPYRQ